MPVENSGLETEIKCIRKKVDEDIRNVKDLEKKLHDYLDEFDNLVIQFCDTNINNSDLSADDQAALVELKKEKTLEVKLNENKVSLFDKYVHSYLYSFISIREDMIKSNKTVMFYSYMFNIVHFLELVIKYLYVSNIKEFTTMEAKHTILSLYQERREKILSLGVTEYYFEKLIESLNKIQNLVRVGDIAMAFKYPLDKEFKNFIIKDEIFDMDMNQLSLIVVEHKLLLYIVWDIYVLAKKSKYNEFIQLIVEITDGLKKDFKYL